MGNETGRADGDHFSDSVNKLVDQLAEQRDASPDEVRQNLRDRQSEILDCFRDPGMRLSEYVIEVGEVIDMWVHTGLIDVRLEDDSVINIHVSNVDVGHDNYPDIGEKVLLTLKDGEPIFSGLIASQE